ncbi:unnamed protein product [Spirodela intermedia]|uniref:Uncharacterized protein n=1 Tax=Spirodela intermedia TaxID=51605 RepID=A0A7I8L4I3_SPIIN|nr:unnamed protein product [Spirodela intermedia]
MHPLVSTDVQLLAIGGSVGRRTGEMRSGGSQRP